MLCALADVALAGLLTTTLLGVLWLDGVVGLDASMQMRPISSAAQGCRRGPGDRIRLGLGVAA